MKRLLLMFTLTASMLCITQKAEATWSNMDILDDQDKSIIGSINSNISEKTIAFSGSEKNVRKITFEYAGISGHSAYYYVSSTVKNIDEIDDKDWNRINTATTNVDLNITENDKIFLKHSYSYNNNTSTTVYYLTITFIRVPEVIYTIDGIDGSSFYPPSTYYKYSKPSITMNIAFKEEADFDTRNYKIYYNKKRSITTVEDLEKDEVEEYPLGENKEFRVDNYSERAFFTISTVIVKEENGEKTILSSKDIPCRRIFFTPKCVSGDGETTYTSVHNIPDSPIKLKKDISNVSISNSTLTVTESDYDDIFIYYSTDGTDPYIPFSENITIDKNTYLQYRIVDSNGDKINETFVSSVSFEKSGSSTETIDMSKCVRIAYGGYSTYSYYYYMTYVAEKDLYVNKETSDKITFYINTTGSPYLWEKIFFIPEGLPVLIKWSAGNTPIENNERKFDIPTDDSGKAKYQDGKYILDGYTFTNTLHYQETGDVAAPKEAEQSANGKYYYALTGKANTGNPAVAQWKQISSDDNKTYCFTAKKAYIVTNTYYQASNSAIELFPLDTDFGLSVSNAESQPTDIGLTPRTAAQPEGFASGAVYNLQGARVADGSTSLQSLPKGLYIVNGRKYVVK